MRSSYHTRDNIPETIFSGVLTRIDRVNVELVLWDSKGVDVVAAVNYMVSDFSIYQTHLYKFLYQYIITSKLCKIEKNLTS